MRYYSNENKKLYYKKPIEINKYIDKEILANALGANLYMNGITDIFKKIINGSLKNVGSISICFEDATKESELSKAEENIQNALEKLIVYSENKEIEVPLIFIRVRNEKQFINFTQRLNEKTIKLITGFTLPKFDTTNAEIYLNILDNLNKRFNEITYAMPILESSSIIFKESRMEELIKLKEILNEYSELILNIRVGGTDFSSQFGIRRSVNSNIYSIGVVSECLIDIINMFGRKEEQYVISAPVWEYFSKDINSKEVQGLLNEIEFDKENGFFGKTVVHPTQVKYVNGNCAITFEEYIDAKNIIKSAEEGGVFKGYNDNKMNEVLPHLSWARKKIIRAEAFGVLNKGINNEELYK